MCIQTALQTKIAELTDNGDMIARFLANTVQGAIPGAKLCHRIDAAKTLARYGAQVQPAGNRPPALSDSTEEGRDSGEKSLHTQPAQGPEPDRAEEPEPRQIPTLRDIVGYPVARYIRRRTNNGDTMIDTLNDIMEGGSYSKFDYAFKHDLPLVKPSQRLSAAKELMSRAMGESKPPRAESSTPARPKLILSSADGPILTDARKIAEEKPAFELDPSDPINSGLARLVRDKTNDGINAAETMIRIAEDDGSEGYWLPAHRLVASKELLHRAYDLNYDAVTWEDVMAFKRAGEDAEEAKRVDLARARYQAELSAIIKEFQEAYEAGDEEAMKAAEKKHTDFRRGGKLNPDEPIEYHKPPPSEGDDQGEDGAMYGPADPDPTAKFHTTARDRESQANFHRQVAKRQANRKSDPNHNAAAIIHAPRLTVRLRNRSP